MDYVLSKFEKAKQRPNHTKFKYQNKTDIFSRTAESKRIRLKYPDRIPVVCESLDPEVELDKNKYLVPSDLTVGQFLYVIRRRIRLGPEKALFLFSEHGTLPPTSQILSTLYETEKNKDGFLYYGVTTENTFG